ncbi:MAG: hypothetical protein IT342_17895 [Candidatus Melainabacteria bacterium]|nr:hypothetical protein [Candidatus Melainabacteria bacterium]
MGALMFCIFYCLGMLFMSVVVGISFTSAAGVVACFLTTTAVFASADLSCHLVRGPFNRFFSALLRARELGALLMLLFMFVLIGGITGSVILGWAALAPQAFTANPMAVGEAFRLGFSAALLDGILVVIGFPNRFSELAKLAERYRPRR